MKKLLSILSVVSVLNFGVITTSNAQGIPVYDNAQTLQNAQNFLKEMQEMAEQLKTATDQLNTAKDQLSSFKDEALQMKKRLEGFSNFGQNFSVDDFAKSLDSIIGAVDKATVNDFMSSNGLNKFDDEQLKKHFTRQAETYSKYDALVKNLESKDQQLTNLKKQFDSADTPQKREEISNTISLEKAKMDNINKTAEYELKKAEIQNQAKEKAEYNEYMKSKFGGY